MGDLLNDLSCQEAQAFVDVLKSDANALVLTEAIMTEIIAALCDSGKRLRVATQLLLLARQQIRSYYPHAFSVVCQDGELSWINPDTKALWLRGKKIELFAGGVTDRFLLKRDGTPCWIEKYPADKEECLVIGETRGKRYPDRSMTSFRLINDEPFAVVERENPETERYEAFVVHGHQEGEIYRGIGGIHVVCDQPLFVADDLQQYGQRYVIWGDTLEIPVYRASLFPYREGFVLWVQATEESHYSLVYYTQDDERVLATAPYVYEPVLVPVDGVQQLVWAEKTDDQTTTVYCGEDRLVWWSGVRLTHWSGPSRLNSLCTYCGVDSNGVYTLRVNNTDLFTETVLRRSMYSRYNEATRILTIEYEDGLSPHKREFDLVALGVVSASSSLSP